MHRPTIWIPDMKELELRKLIWRWWLWSCFELELELGKGLSTLADLSFAPSDYPLNVKLSFMVAPVPSGLIYVIVLP